MKYEEHHGYRFKVPSRPNYTDRIGKLTTRLLDVIDAMEWPTGPWTWAIIIGHPFDSINPCVEIRYVDDKVYSYKIEHLSLTNDYEDHELRSMVAYAVKQVKREWTTNQVEFRLPETFPNSDEGTYANLGSEQELSKRLAEIDKLPEEKLGIICRGTYMLGTACKECIQCERERIMLALSGGFPKDWL